MSPHPLCTHYHATFSSNEKNILKWGLRRDHKRIWGCSGKKFVYLAKSYDEALWWILQWYQYNLWDMVSKESDYTWGNLWGGFGVERLESLMTKVPMIDDGVVVFGIDTRGLNVITRCENPEEEPIDYIVEGDISEVYLRVIGREPAEKVKRWLHKKIEIQ